MQKVVGYVRVSRVGGREGDSFQSPARQEQDIRAYCKQHGLKLTEVITELDESGAKLNRSKLQAVVEGIQSGTYAGVVVANIDRLTRLAARDRVQLFDSIEDAGGIIRSAAQELDTSTPAGRFTRELFLSLARMEWEQKAEAFDRSKATAVARGVHISAVAPFGYVRRKGQPLEVESERASIVRAAFELRASGASLREVRDYLDGVAPGGPRGGRAWSVAVTRDVLKNRAYLGEARHGEHFMADAHEPLVTPRLFDTVQAMFRQRERPIRTNATKLLAGVLRCGTCGYAMTETQAGGKYAYRIYRCSGSASGCRCAAPAMAMRDGLEQLVLDAVATRLRKGAAGRLHERIALDADLDELHLRLASARNQRAPFEDPAYVAALGIDAALRALAQVDEQITAIEDEMALASQAPSTALPLYGELPKTFLGLETAEQREVIGAMVEGIIVSRAPRGTALADRVEIVWSGEGTIDRPSVGLPRQAVVEARVAAA